MRSLFSWGRRRARESLPCARATCSQPTCSCSTSTTPAPSWRAAWEPSRRLVDRAGYLHRSRNGGMSEAHQAQELADQVKAVRSAGVAGSFVFEWQDDWSARAWNTLAAVDQLKAAWWNDVQTAGQGYERHRQSGRGARLRHRRRHGRMGGAAAGEHRWRAVRSRRLRRGGPVYHGRGRRGRSRSRAVHRARHGARRGVLRLQRSPGRLLVRGGFPRGARRWSKEPLAGPRALRAGEGDDASRDSGR